jgi:hypothetical protein
MSEEEESPEEKQEKIKRALKRVQEELDAALESGIFAAVPLRGPRRGILNAERKVVPCPDLMEWAAQFENSENRRVGYDQLGPYVISTVFLGLDHAFRGPPLWFETMLFSEKSGKTISLNYQTRYTTFEEALEGHKTVVQLVEEGVLP